MKFAVLDFETTGSQPADEIIQVGLVIIEDFQIVDRYSSLIKPTIPISPFIHQLTGISDDTVMDAPPLEEIMPDIQKRIHDCTLVAHHLAFDLSFLQRALDLSGYLPFSGRVLDTMDVLPIAFPMLPGFQLSVVSHALGIVHDRPHQADSDAEVTAKVWLSCLHKLLDLPLITVQRIAQLFADEPSDIGWLLTELLLLKEQRIAPDSDSFHYHRQYAMAVDDWGEEEELRDSAETKEQMAGDFDTFYGRIKNALQQRFEQFEEREAQVKMLQEVTDSFQSDKHLMIEAGTGTGKSLGYLIPALYYGIKEEKKVIVSTHTINLQEQLRRRDIPLLHDIFPAPFRAALLKGRSHYLCLRKFEQKVGYQDYEPVKDERITAAQMVVWLSETGHGDDEELNFGSRGNEFWHSVSSDADSCLNRACPWFKKCFYHRARNDANAADVVITNHSLLFTDIKAESRILPGYKHLVIDEAHHFEEVASKHLGIDLTYMAVSNTFLRLYKDIRNGQMPLLKLRLSQLTGEHIEKSAERMQKIDELYDQFSNAKQSFDDLASLLYNLLAGLHPIDGDAGQLLYRIKNEELPPGWDKLLLVHENVHVTLGDALKQTDKLMNALKEEDEPELQGLLTDLSSTIKDLQRHRESLQFFMQRTDSNFVYWLEASSFFKTKSLQIVCVPIDVSSMLREYFFEAKDSIIMTSATLSVDKKFDYTCEQFGLTPGDGKLKTVLLPSPFNYRKQALVVIPRDFPTLKGASGDAYFISCLILSLRDVAIQTKGRMLVLFTSNRMLRQVYTGLKEELAQHGISVLGQSVDSSNRSKLVRMFQEQPATVLLGTNSFWEGVDIPGEALTCLAIVRLPFQPPNHPVVEAKSDNLKQNGLNPFMKLSVPQAVIRFKQGFGRLVRTASDRGIVLLYDTRVIDTFYGKYFLYSLPGPKIEHMKTSLVVPRIKEWMEEGKALENT